MDRAGFEPAASALRTRRSYRADLPAHEIAFEMNLNRGYRGYGNDQHIMVLASQRVLSWGTFQPI